MFSRLCTLSRNIFSYSARNNGAASSNVFSCCWLRLTQLNALNRAAANNSAALTGGGANFSKKFVGLGDVAIDLEKLGFGHALRGVHGIFGEQGRPHAIEASHWLWCQKTPAYLSRGSIVVDARSVETGKTTQRFALTSPFCCRQAKPDSPPACCAKPVPSAHSALRSTRSPAAGRDWPRSAWSDHRSRRHP